MPDTVSWIIPEPVTGFERLRKFAVGRVQTEDPDALCDITDLLFDGLIRLAHMNPTIVKSYQHDDDDWSEDLHEPGEGRAVVEHHAFLDELAAYCAWRSVGDLSEEEAADMIPVDRVKWFALQIAIARFDSDFDPGFAWPRELLPNSKGDAL